MEIIEPGNQYENLKFQSEERRGFIQFIMKISGGHIKTERQAEMSLIIIAAIAVLGTIYLLVVKPILEAPPESTRGSQSHSWRP